MSDAVEARPKPGAADPAGLSPRWPGPVDRDEERRLLAGRRSRTVELLSAVRVFLEFVRGFRALHFVGPCVTVFGSARFPEEHRYYQLARRMGERLARQGFTVMTGGGPGIMEAANRGAREGGGRTIGCNIRLPREQEVNPYVDRFVEFEHFFVRKVMLVKYSHAFVVMPGGFGTMDEVFETMTLMQTRKIESFPIVLMGTEYWSFLSEFLRRTMVAEGTISASDLDFLHPTDSVEEAAALIRESYEAHRRERVPRMRALLGERGATPSRGGTFFTSLLS